MNNKDIMSLIFLALAVIVATWLVIWTVNEDVDNPIRIRESNEQTARFVAAEHLATYNTAAAIGETEKMCVEARSVLYWMIEAHDVEAAKTSQDLVRIACAKEQ